MDAKTNEETKTTKSAAETTTTKTAKGSQETAVQPPASGAAKAKADQQNDSYTLKVKNEYILDTRSSSLRPLLSNNNNNNNDNGDNNRNNNDDDGRKRDDRDNNNNNNSKNKRSRRRNKKRPRDVRQSDSEKICLSTLRGGDEKCPYGDKCRFSHDLKSFMSTRPTDIIEVEGGCPTFNTLGYCVYGATCRVGSNHITKTGENVDNRVAATIKQQKQNNNEDEVEDNNKEGIINRSNAKKSTTIDSLLPLNDQALNVLPRDIQTQLRKKTYPFKCQRYSNNNSNNKKNINSEGKKEATSEKTTTTTTTTTTKEDDRGCEEVEEATKTTERKTVDNETKEEGLMEVENSSKEEGKEDDEKKKASSSSNNIFGPIETKSRKVIDFSNKIYLAPLTTVGNLPFRRIVKGLGADITCGEMALATNLLEGKPSEWALLKRHPSEDVFGIQVASAHADQLTRVSELIENHCQVDFVDLNLGCPIDLICSKGAGAALMMRDKKLKGILSGMTTTLSCPVTVKIRTGWDINKPFAHDLVPKIQSWSIEGLGAIMIHGRSRLQRYQRLADWEYINKVAASQSTDYPKIPVIGNGDIFSFTDYEEKMKIAKADTSGGVSRTAMLARGALIKPWLPTEIKERRHWDISANERLDILKDFVKFGLEHWGSDQQGVNNTRRFLLEWLSFLYRYVPVGLLESPPQQMNQRPPSYMQGRNDLETLFLSANSSDWIQISEMLLGPVPDGFKFEPKHRANGYA